MNKQKGGCSKLVTALVPVSKRKYGTSSLWIRFVLKVFLSAKYVGLILINCYMIPHSKG